MTAQTLGPAEAALERPKSEWTTPVLEVARMDPATRGANPIDPQDDDNNNGVPDACDPDHPAYFPPVFPGGPCEDMYWLLS